MSYAGEFEEYKKPDLSMKVFSKDDKVLIVDDDPEVRDLIQITLEERLGCGTILSPDGKDAITRFNEAKPKVIILDMMLPKKSGFLVMESLKPDRNAERPPYVVMITGNEGPRHEKYALHLGVNEYLLKPVRMERLAALVKQYLEK